MTPSNRSTTFTDSADVAVVNQVISGNVEAFQSLVLRYQRQVMALGLRFFRSTEDAEDFTQDVFLLAFRRLQGFNGSGRFYSWLIRIAYNHGSRTLRRKPRFESLETETVVDTGHSPAEETSRRESKRAVALAIQGLPGRYAECIGLYYFFGLSYPEIAQTTGYPINTVRSHLRRARKDLALILRDFAPMATSAGGIP